MVARGKKIARVLFVQFSGQKGDRARIILFLYIIASLKSTYGAVVQNSIMRSRAHKRWLHHAAAGMRAITWVYIYMLAPKALGTMIGIPIPFDICSAVLAGEIFDTSLKKPAHATAPPLSYSSQILDYFLRPGIPSGRAPNRGWSSR